MKRFLSYLVIAAAIFNFVSCSDDDDDNNNGGNNNGGNNNNPPAITVPDDLIGQAYAMVIDMTADEFMQYLADANGMSLDDLIAMGVTCDPYHVSQTLNFEDAENCYVSVERTGSYTVPGYGTYDLTQSGGFDCGYTYTKPNGTLTDSQDTYNFVVSVSNNELILSLYLSSDTQVYTQVATSKKAVVSGNANALIDLKSNLKIK